MIVMAGMKLIMDQNFNFLYRECKGGDIKHAQKYLLCMHLAIFVLLSWREGFLVIRRMEVNRREKGEINMSGCRERQKREAVPEDKSSRITRA